MVARCFVREKAHHRPPAFAEQRILLCVRGDARGLHDDRQPPTVSAVRRQRRDGIAHQLHGQLTVSRIDRDPSRIEPATGPRARIAALEGTVVNLEHFLRRRLRFRPAREAARHREHPSVIGPCRIQPGQVGLEIRQHTRVARQAAQEHPHLLRRGVALHDRGLRAPLQFRQKAQAAAKVEQCEVRGRGNPPGRRIAKGQHGRTRDGQRKERIRQRQRRLVGAPQRREILNERGLQVVGTEARIGQRDPFAQDRHRRRALTGLDQLRSKFLPGERGDRSRSRTWGGEMVRAESGPPIAEAASPSHTRR